MWGKIVTEATFETNFNTQFPNTKTDVLIHLAQWQYWWWFWFSFLWVLYYLFLARTLRYRTLKFRPKIVSSFRPHGKWGDVIICLLPVSWCANILINSNFLLKLLEWQAESSLFTIRIRGKQWYWVYKFDFRNFSDIISTPKNIGNNKWMFSFFGDLKTSDNYLHIIQMRAQNKWIKKYWIKNLGKFEQDEKSNINLIQDFFKIDNFKKENTILPVTNFLNGTTELNNVTKNLILDLSDTRENINMFSDINNDLADISLYLNKEDNLKTFFPTDVFPTLEKFTMYSGKASFDTVSGGTFVPNTILRNNLFLNSFKLVLPTQEDLFTKNISFLKSNFNFLLKDFQNITNDLSYTSFLTFSTTNTNLSHTEYSYNIFSFQEESNRVAKSLFGKPAPISLIKFPVTYIESTGIKLLKFRYNDQNSKVTSRNMLKVPYFVFKQVRYKRRKSAFATAHVFYDSLGNEKSIKKNFSLNNQYSIEQDIKNPTRYYRMFKKNRVRSENMPVVVAKRLLRVKRTLVIPTHINITAITNSYDVVHSWFIPGLGLKMDCVPGRSTHHTFYVDNAGFYYGQCAEICGRYHHHMPIRVCALPFEHFLIWWQSIGLPKLLYPNKKYNMLKSHSFRKFVW